MVLDVYPIGKPQIPTVLDEGAVRRSIEAITLLPGELRRSVDGCRDLDHQIREGAWSIRALVHHVADSHMIAFVRTKLALTADDPTVEPYDVKAWSQTADNRMEVEASLELVEALHLRWAGLLASLGPAELERSWRVPGGESRPLWRLPLVYAWHGEHHVAQIRQARVHFEL